MSLLNNMLEYARRSWPQVLLYGVENGVCTCQRGALCEQKGKHPIPECSQRRATTDPKVLEEWSSKYAELNPNLGVLTGISSGVVVLDVDPRSGGEASLAELLKNTTGLPITLTCQTGGNGQHYYFQCSSDLVLFTTMGSLGRGLDFKANSPDGKAPGYVIVPPSRTEEQYKWRNSEAIIANIPDWLVEKLLSSHEDRETQFEGLDEIKEGQRHNFLLSRAGKLRHDNWSSDAILHALLTENQSKCRPPLSDDEVKSIAQGILGYNSPLFRLNDVGNAKRLVYKFGTQLRHCVQQKSWYIWEGRYWARDSLKQIESYAKQTVEWMHDDAKMKGDLAPLLRRHASQSGRADRIKAMIDMALSEEEVRVSADALDGYPLLLNCPNCVLDLEHGTSLEHDPALLMTKITTTEYHPNAVSETWETFLKDTTNGDEQLQVFLQRISGYALSGLTVEENIFFIHGPGGTGKSTFFETIKSVMGDGYCKTASFATFLRSKNGGGGGPRSDIARLPGARLVTAVETEDGKQFAADLLKISTGGDKITTRDLYQSEFEFLPQYKIWLAANSKPRVSSEDSGIWRRLLLIPFEHVPSNPNKRLKDLLRASKKDREGILAWMVRGFLDWQKSGWIVPSVVSKKTKEYRTEMDSIEAWMADSCLRDNTISTPLRTLWEAYEDWVRRQPQAMKEMRVETLKAFTDDLAKKGFIIDVQASQGRALKMVIGLVIIY